MDASIDRPSDLLLVTGVLTLVVPSVVYVFARVGPVSWLFLGTLLVLAAVALDSLGR